MPVSTAPSSTPPPTSRRLRPTPDRLVVALLAAVCLLWLAERFDWFGVESYKGWPVLFAVAAVALTAAALLAWFLASLIFHWRFQLRIRALLLLAVICSIDASWFTVEFKNARVQAKLVAQIRQSHSYVQFDHDISPPAKTRLSIINRLEAFLSQSGLGDDFFCSIYGVTIGGYKQPANDDIKRLIDIPHLHALSFYETPATDSGMKYIGQLAELRELNLDETGITDAGLQYVGQLTELSDLVLRADPITNAGVKQLGKLTRLRKLDLSATPITDAGLEPIGKLTELTELSISQTRITDAGLRYLAGCMNLQDIYLDTTQVTGTGTKYFRALAHLRAVTMNITPVTDAGLKQVGTLTQINWLGLSSTKFTDSGLAALEDMPNLRNLYMSECHITGAGLRHVAKLKNLQALDIRMDNLDQRDVDWLQKQLPKCKIVTKGWPP